ncbi:MAG: hypothetical protein N2Z60_01180 [Elusimicrobiales bacterium]|nr:hypothetical protein [Elusimicrobiales bacterium]HOJ86472.1 hypothetical protein [Elusimicrobiales bacterium]HOL62172.1 hypothetical protein [Elusimicrobiales bacterium]HPO94683.1 hypothetical protein [Elusimicrobiales bacterium]
MKVAISVISLFFTLNIYSSESAVNKEVPVKPTQSAIKTYTAEYITQSEFEKILKEAEDKLKMEKDKNKKLRDYVFEMLPIKTKMSQEEKMRTSFSMNEFADKYPLLAIKIYDKEISLDPTNPNAYAERASVYYSLCMKESEKNYYNENFDKTYCKKYIEDADNALKYIKSNKELDMYGIPFRMRLYSSKGDIYRFIYKDFSKAIENYDKAIKSDVFQPSQEYINRARAYCDMNDYEKAKKDLKTYFKRDFTSEPTRMYETYDVCRRIYKKTGEVVTGCAEGKLLDSQEEFDKFLKSVGLLR